MKAAVLYGDMDIRYEDYPTPEIKPGTVKVHVRAAGICGSDIPRVLQHGAHFYPIILGHEFSGDIVEIGEGVQNRRIGDAVVCVPLIPCLKCVDCLNGNFSLCKNYSFIGSREQGGFADYVVVPATNTVICQPGITFEQGAMFEPSTVALHAIQRNGFQGGSAVAILGGGTIGVFVLQWVKLFGAKKIVVFDIDPCRLSLAQKLGADMTVNTLDPEFMLKTVEFTGGKGFDDVYETAGKSFTMQLAFEIAASKSRICFVGTPNKDLCFTPHQWRNLNRKEFQLAGSWMSYSSPFPGQEWELTAHYCATGQLKFNNDLIFKRYPMSSTRQAFELYLKPEQVKGKIILYNDF